MPRDLRYDVLHHRAGLRDRLRAIGADPRLVLGGTIAVLLVVVPAAITVGLVLAGTFGDDGGALAVLAMLFLAGLWTLGSLLREGAKGSALTRFARVNKLDVVEASAMPVYAGSLFADGSRIISQSVRTRERPFVEVGDTFLITAPKARYNPALGRVQAGAPNQPELFLRGQLSRQVPRQQIALDPALQQRLSDFAGDHVVEVAADEVTVAGSQAARCRRSRPGRGGVRAHRRGRRPGRGAGRDLAGRPHGGVRAEGREPPASPGARGDR